ncbi:glycerol-3-phosphate dehydrogenase/oxidase [Tundrisphaera lichenicola]|uniref:glycerol-3-phosphate dehydrogenase/oxidase n=1 Tax=Tundrisphaera lichenicola TaxID=2029860 RepID=UPI003EBA284D
MISRHQLLDRLRNAPCWDLVVIGGGASGLGAALDAASRGLTTLLIESADFAQGTSSRSTKLLHGGVRYLAQGKIGLVREALHERTILLRNAPHLAHTLEFVVPAESRASLFYYGLGLRAYDLLAGRDGLGLSRVVGRAELIQLAPTLKPGRFRGGIIYKDGQFDDARYAISLVRTIFERGGLAINAMPLVGFVKERGRISGVEARDIETGETFRINARTVINATGVEVDIVRLLDDSNASPTLAPSRGSHLILDRKFLPGRAGVMIPKTDDGRVLFAIPWHDKVLLGTTDTPVDRVTREPRPSTEEIQYLLDHAGRYFAERPRLEDIRSVFAGLRPLIGRGGSGRTSSISREHAIFVSDSGLVTITGGKWTTYRRMGREVVDRAIDVSGLPRSPSRTEFLRIQGWTDQIAMAPFSIYGSDARKLERLVEENPEWGEKIHSRLTALEVEVIWACRFEFARSVEDVLARRTRSLFLDARSSVEAAPLVASLMAGELGFDRSWEASQVEAFRDLASNYLPD